MALDPTAREANIWDSIKRYFLDNLSYELTFDRALSSPAIRGTTVDRWVSFALDDIAGVVAGLLDDLRISAVVDWNQKSFSVFGESIMLPLLDLNYAAIAEFRNSAMNPAGPQPLRS